MINTDIKNSGTRVENRVNCLQFSAFSTLVVWGTIAPQQIPAKSLFYVRSARKSKFSPRMTFFPRERVIKYIWNSISTQYPTKKCRRATTKTKRIFESSFLRRSNSDYHIEIISCISLSKKPRINRDSSLITRVSRKKPLTHPFA